MEVLVLRAEYTLLFTDEEQRIATKRLEECGFNPDIG
jgi:hypothetical protein